GAYLGVQPLERARVQVAGGGGAGTASIPASLRWEGVIGVGAPVSGSAPEAALGKAITSRNVSAPASGMTTPSQPDAVPPGGGGGPSLKGSSRKPTCDRASSGDSPITSNTCCCIALRWIRIDPPPIS